MKMVSLGSLLKFASMCYLILQGNSVLAEKNKEITETEDSNDYGIKYTEFQFSFTENPNSTLKLVVTKDFTPRDPCYLGKSLQSQLYDDVVEVGQQFQQGQWCNSMNATFSTINSSLLFCKVKILVNCKHVDDAVKLFEAYNGTRSNISLDQQCVQQVLLDKAINPYYERMNSCEAKRIGGMVGGFSGVVILAWITASVTKCRKRKQQEDGRELKSTLLSHNRYGLNNDDLNKPLALKQDNAQTVYIENSL